LCYNSTMTKQNIIIAIIGLFLLYFFANQGKFVKGEKRGGKGKPREK